MLSYFAATTDPVTALSSGNYLLLLAFIIVTLAGVIVALTRYFTKKLDSKDTEIRDLNKLIYTEGKAHTLDYREMAKDNSEVLQGNSQSIQLMAAKIEAVKGQR